MCLAVMPTVSLTDTRKRLERQNLDTVQLQDKCHNDRKAACESDYVVRSASSCRSKFRISFEISASLFRYHYLVNITIFDGKCITVRCTSHVFDKK